MNPEIFKGLLVTPGDKISFKLNSVDTPASFQTAVISVSTDGSTLSVIVPLMLSRFKPDGLIHENEIERISIIEKAKEAVWRETKKRLLKDQEVVTKIKGSSCACKIVAAYDGIVVAKRKDGEYVTGGSYYFDPA